MRHRRLATLAPLTFLLAACAVDGQDVDNQAVSQDVFASRDEQAKKLAGDIGIEKVAERDIARGAGDLKVERVHIDESGEAVTRVAQSIDGIPVFGAQAVVELDTRGGVKDVHDYLERDLRVEPATISEADAIKIAYGAVDGVVSRTRAADKQILARKQLGAVVTHRIQLEATDHDGMPSLPVIFVDARTGEVVNSYDNLQTAKNRKTYTASGSQKTTIPGTLQRSEGQAAVADAVVNAAHDNAGITYDFYFNNFGRDSYNGSGATLTSSVHYSNSYVNAYWDGNQMVYGDGDGTNASALTVLDVVGHELTHAVTEYASGLIYQNESGALNEAFSDIFGASIEAYRDGAVSGNTWKIGEECWTPGTAGDALRYMNDPAIAGDYDYYPTRYTGTQDNGGVHWNSGIANLAFYLAVAGGSHPRGKTSNVVTPLASNALESIQKGAAIFYQANTACLGPSAKFSDARACTIAAANSLYGAAAATTIGDAWTAVGVGAAPTYSLLGTVSNISVGSKKWSSNYTQVTPAGSKSLKIEISGGTGDADLYVRFGSAPTTSSYACRPYLEGNNEVCEFTPPQSGTYYIKLYGYSSSSGITLKTYSAQ
ncbi:M4 family metallopeptidase [Polyangium mundeleinium]|uniref:Neutral metalloproteinase n=1 Tax=Polyangium mundeleinium TaxID=2995306 RepID=A0ABT5ETK9_9BACT|nr:M4 family metallopeptidase [Polyangium mundeleinium]MDC0745101.1 M4 family metallopeptidase [Polyangium mundeleinium]